MYTCLWQTLTKKVVSGDRGGQGIGPPLLIHRFLQVIFNNGASMWWCTILPEINFDKINCGDKTNCLNRFRILTTIALVIFICFCFIESRNAANNLYSTHSILKNSLKHISALKQRQSKLRQAKHFSNSCETCKRYSISKLKFR